jgi:hypothetical protein
MASVTKEWTKEMAREKLADIQNTLSTLQETLDAMRARREVEES